MSIANQQSRQWTNCWGEDAAIVAIARQRKAEFVATFDRGFEQIKGLTVVPGK
jgi:predicted nucleic acid-binding protein